MNFPLLTVRLTKVMENISVNWQILFMLGSTSAVVEGEMGAIILSPMTIKLISFNVIVMKQSFCVLDLAISLYFSSTYNNLKCIETN